MYILCNVKTYVLKFKQKSNIILILKSPFKLINKKKHLNLSTKLLYTKNTMKIYLKKYLCKPSFYPLIINSYFINVVGMNHKYTYLI